MQTSKHSTSHDDLPEVAQAEPTAYKYSVPIDPTPHAGQDSKEVVPHGFEPGNVAHRRRWTRWPLLLLYAVLIAVVAGVIGGFIGKAITNSPKNDTLSSTEFSPPTNTSTTDTSTNDTLARILPIPTTNCPSISEQQYISSTSDYTQTPYTIMCATRWTNAHLVAISAATPSDCIEACESYNDNAPTDRTCLGASFVPRWWNQTQAMAMKNEPYDCFLMGENSTIFQNDQPFEIVALCLKSKDACPGIL